MSDQVYYGVWITHKDGTHSWASADGRLIVSDSAETMKAELPIGEPRAIPNPIDVRVYRGTEEHPADRQLELFIRPLELSVLSTAETKSSPIAWRYDCPACGVPVGMPCHFNGKQPIDPRICHFTRERIARFGAEHDQAVKDRCAEAAARFLRSAAEADDRPEVKTALSALLLGLPGVIRGA